MSSHVLFHTNGIRRVKTSLMTFNLIFAFILKFCSRSTHLAKLFAILTVSFVIFKPYTWSNLASNGWRWQTDCLPMLVNHRAIPFHQLPLMELLFSMDLIRLFHQSAQGCHFVLCNMISQSSSGFWYWRHRWHHGHQQKKKAICYKYYIL